MDMTETTQPKSDQQNYDDVANAPRTVTIAEVKRGTAEQPVEIHLIEYPGRPYKPSKTMRRLLIDAWGKDSTVYAGRRMTLKGDPSIRFGGVAVGGIVISHLSDITKRHEPKLTVSKGHRAPVKVDPLVEQAPAPQPTEPSESDVATCTDLDQLRAWWKPSGPERRAQIKPRMEELIEADQ